MDSDIRNLYASFDGTAEIYREVYHEERCIEAARRWRLLGKILAMMEQPAAQMPHPYLHHADRDPHAGMMASAGDVETGPAHVPSRTLESLFQRIQATQTELPVKR